MEITVSENQDQVHLELAGSLDDQGAGELRQSLDLLEQSAGKQVVLDFAKVSYVGSSGLGVLLQLYKRLSLQGTALKIVNLPTFLRSLFQVVKLDELFGISPAQ